MDEKDTVSPIDNEHETTDAAAAEPGEPETEADLTNENAALKDKLLRALAEVENIRQRATRDADEARRYAVTGFARDLLDVADNLRRALDNVPESENTAYKSFVDGVEMTERSLLNAFNKAKIEKVVPNKGERFDHKVHQAMFEVPTTELAPGHIAEIMQPGYVIAGRLLRPALVGVSKAMPAEAPAEPNAAMNPPGSQIDTQA